MTIRMGRVSVLALVALGLVAGALLAGEAAKPAKRSAMEVMKDLEAASREFQQAVPNAEVLLDAKKRAEIAPKAIPPLKKMLALVQELPEMGEHGMNSGNARTQFMLLLSLLGDQETDAELAKGAQSKDAKEALASKSTILAARWLKQTSVEDQAKAVDEMQALAKANPEDEGLTMHVMLMLQQGALNKELKSRVEQIIINDLKGQMAKQLAGHIQGQQKLRSMEGKPLVIEGVTHDGKKFSSADWKGKVILVDFWATWCGPCIKELPRVKKVYADNHAKGLEILGVSCDQSDAALKGFLAKNLDMPWPQLFDASKPGWHALATEYGIDGIPTMFLIDRKGILRSVEARADFEVEIPKLLEEKAE